MCMVLVHGMVDLLVDGWYGDQDMSNHSDYEG